MRTLDDSLALRAAVTAVDRPRVVVIGAGFIGAEVASTCAGLGCRVTVLEALDIPLRNVLGPVIGAHFAARCTEPTGWSCAPASPWAASAAPMPGQPAGDARAGRLVVELGGGEVLPADVVVVGIGVVPSTDWLVGLRADRRERCRV